MDKAILKGFRAILREYKGLTDEDVLNMPLPRFWLMLELLAEEAEERKKEMEKSNKKKHGKR